MVRSNHGKTKDQSTKKVEASSSQFPLTSQTDWDTGTKDNIDSSSFSGSIKINNLASSMLNLSGKTTVANADIANKDLAVDSNSNTSWGLHPLRSDASDYWQIDLGQEYNLKKISTISSCAAIYNDNFYYSTDGTNWALFNFHNGCGTDPATTEGVIDINARYVRFVPFAPVPNCPPDVSCGFVEFYELSLYAPATAATHTTAPTQIDGGANFWQWETFADTKTVPANTSVTYRFRTSTNGSDWTNWVGSIGAVTSRTGDDSNDPVKYRYLQVETTLSNTDGASTPTLSDYSIGYHTNRPPDKPVAGTVIIGQ